MQAGRLIQRNYFELEFFFGERYIGGGIPRAYSLKGAGMFLVSPAVELIINKMFFYHQSDAATISNFIHVALEGDDNAGG